VELSPDGRPRQDLRERFVSPPRMGPRPLQDLDALPIQQSSLTHGPCPLGGRLGISRIKSPVYIENVAGAQAEPDCGYRTPSSHRLIAPSFPDILHYGEEKTVPCRGDRQDGTVLVNPLAMGKLGQWAGAMLVICTMV
jgi:hypothetical protein